MKVVQVSTYDREHGAGRAVYRLHQGLLPKGCGSRVFSRYATLVDEGVRALVLRKDWRSRLHRSLRWRRLRRDWALASRTRPAGYELFSDDRSPYDRDLVGQVPAADIVNLHWVGGVFLDLAGFLASEPPQRPLVWTLHDMNPFTGGCHYDAGCGRFTGGCGLCPQLGSHDPGDLSSRVWRRKQQVFGAIAPERLHIVAPSHWLARVASCSPLLGRFAVSTIPNGVDIIDFAPRDRRCARDVLRIPGDATVVLFVSSAVQNRRKGFELLRSACQGLERGRGVYLAAVGNEPPPTESGPPVRHFGWVRDDRWLSMIYSAADVFVTPSLQDNLPNTVLEAMACGTPVIGFDVGGIPDMVRPGQTGWLVPPGDVDGLRDAIRAALGDRARREAMATECRRVVEQEYTLELQARRYLELYRRMLAAARAGGAESGA